MSSWLFLLAAALAILAALHFAGLRGRLLQLAAAAILVGGVGYALQGRPGLAGAPAVGTAARPPVPLSGPRQAFFGQFNSAERWLVMADSYALRGNTKDSAGLIRSALRSQPDNAELWAAYGNALVDHSGGMITPPADYAYRRAEALAPNHPGPLFFHGLALGRSGQAEAALAAWRRAMALSPANASWVPGLRLAIAQVEAKLSAPPSDSRAAASPPSAAPGTAPAPAGSEPPTP